uniref:UPAR/Ly6 domain-containing protein n=1 Tax=Neogobius melanostomus TaxID=47308 RepID=A0A8C6V2B5_9GOBI
INRLMEAATLEDENSLECFRCDLGFWDACYTLKTNCSHTERCYTGRGKAADVLDVKTLGCLFTNKTIFIMTKHCCDTPLCNSACRHPTNLLLWVFLMALTARQLGGASLGPH